MELNSIIYTVFADDRDNGNASKVSYSIEEVSAGMSSNNPGIILAGTSACWGVGAGRMLGVPGPPQQALCANGKVTWLDGVEPGQALASPLSLPTPQHQGGVRACWRAAVHRRVGHAIPETYS